MKSMGDVMGRGWEGGGGGRWGTKFNAFLFGG